MDAKKRARLVLARLRKTHTEPGEFVRWSNALELVIGTVLSAQCTDKRVNIVTKKLFKKYTTARAYARANLVVLEKEIYSTGFYKSKARYLKGIGEILEKKFHGKVPGSLLELLELPGVSYKSAHLVMAKVFGEHTGIAVDTHVKRVAPRLGLTSQSNPDKIGKDLEKLFDTKDYLDVNEYLIMHGRAVCTPRPQCPSCVLKDICPSARKFYSKEELAAAKKGDRV